MKQFILLALISLPLYAQNFSFNKETGKAVPNFVGELKLLKGRVLRTTGGKPKVVQTGEKFYQDDVVVTEENSSMKILMTDNTWLSLGPKSELVFSKYEFTDKNDRTSLFQLVRGQLSSNVREKVKKGSVEYRTNQASMGVRGTKVLMNYREVKGVAVSEYALIEGKAEIKDMKGNNHELNAGERIVLMENQKSKEGTLEKLQLTKEDLESFSSPEADEDKSIRPLMPYYEPESLTMSSSDESEMKVERKNESSKSGDGSFQNLKKLNEQLQDNQKKRKK